MRARRNTSLFFDAMNRHVSRFISIVITHAIIYKFRLSDKYYFNKETIPNMLDGKYSCKP